MKYLIKGGDKVEGKIKNSGAKNAILPILAACIINGKENILYNWPKLRDVIFILEILESIGCKVEKNDEYLLIDSSNISTYMMPEHLVKEMRSSIIFMGAMLSRTGKVIQGMPGGCDIGLRPIDLHLKSLKMLGANIIEESGLIKCLSENMKGTEINLDIPSVGATENIMLAAVSIKGTTIIRNAAREPEIVDLQNFLNIMGGNIKGAGSNIIKIEGVEKFNKTEYTIMPDRIVAGTYLSMATITGGSLEISNVIPEHISSIIQKFREMGCYLKVYQDKVYIKSDEKLLALDNIRTLPYPGFPTDMQAPIMSVCGICKGTSTITETIFENRFKHIPELVKMGANILVNDRVAIIRGIKRYHSASVEAKDLRGGAALITAALNAEGITEVSGTKYIERGYEEIDKKLSEIGINIQKIL